MNLDTELILVRIDSKYCNYLRKFDERVPFNHSNKELRPFIGVLFKVNNIKYFAPLSSPKQKHLKMKSKLDFLRLDGGRLGAINFNNMIPVRDINIEKIDLDKECILISERKYQKLLKEQIFWLNRNSEKLYDRSRKLYNSYVRGILDKNIMDRCCNYKLLEEKCVLYEDSYVEVRV